MSEHVLSNLQEQECDWVLGKVIHLKEVRLLKDQKETNIVQIHIQIYRDRQTAKGYIQTRSVHITRARKRQTQSWESSFFSKKVRLLKQVQERKRSCLKNETNREETRESDCEKNMSKQVLSKRKKETNRVCRTCLNTCNKFSKSEVIARSKERQTETRNTNGMQDLPNEKETKRVCKREPNRVVKKLIHFKECEVITSDKQKPEKEIDRQSAGHVWSRAGLDSHLFQKRIRERDKQSPERERQIARVLDMSEHVLCAFRIHFRSCEFTVTFTPSAVRGQRVYIQEYLLICCLMLVVCAFVVVSGLGHFGDSSR